MVAFAIVVVGGGGGGGIINKQIIPTGKGVALYRNTPILYHSCLPSTNQRPRKV